ncbi:MAG: helix-turn-helix domain-containing protein [Chloroflexi bacterium]|nr:helix-turn-helix domain-containing protein [Chloroflexota bacterium]
MTALAEPRRRDFDLNPSFVGEVLRSIREQRGLTQREVADPLGMSEAGYGHYEAGRARLTVGDLRRFSLALHVNLEDLMERLGLLPAPDSDPPTIEMILRSIRRTPHLSEEDKEAFARLIERSRRILHGEPDADGA